MEYRAIDNLSRRLSPRLCQALRAFAGGIAAGATNHLKTIDGDPLEARVLFENPRHLRRTVMRR